MCAGPEIFLRIETVLNTQEMKVQMKRPNVNKRKTIYETRAEDFYYVNYVNINHSVKNSTFDCEYSLYFL